MRDQLDRLLRGGKADAHRRPVGKRVEPFERKRQMRAALVVGDGVDFVHDHRLDVAQDLPALLRREQDVERFRRGHQNVRRALQHGAALVHQRVAGAHGGANLRHQQPALARQLQDFAERDFQIFLDVVAQRLQRRDVEHFGAVLRVRRRAPCAPAGRCRPGTPRAFCPSRWARRSAWCGRPGCAASPAPAARWACRTGPRTTPQQ